MIVFEEVSAEIAPSSMAQAAQAAQAGQARQAAPQGEASQATPGEQRPLDQVRHALALLAERQARLQAD